MNFVYQIGSSDGRENFPYSSPSRNWQRVTSRENCPCSGPSRNWQRVTSRENCPRTVQVETGKEWQDLKTSHTAVRVENWQYQPASKSSFGLLWNDYHQTGLSQPRSVMLWHFVSHYKWRTWRVLTRLDQPLSSGGNSLRKEWRETSSLWRVHRSRFSPFSRSTRRRYVIFGLRRKTMS